MEGNQYRDAAGRIVDRETQKKFHLYFKNRSIDLCTQYAFHRHFCLAKKYDFLLYTSRCV